MPPLDKFSNPLGRAHQSIILKMVPSSQSNASIAAAAVGIAINSARTPLLHKADTNRLRLVTRTNTETAGGQTRAHHVAEPLPHSSSPGNTAPKMITSARATLAFTIHW